MLASTEGSNSSATSCDLEQETSQTMWYEVRLQATGTTCIKAELEAYFYPSMLAVYSSGGSCQDLGCLAQSEYGHVALKVEENETYYLVVANRDDGMGYDNIAGPFTLELSVSGRECVKEPVRARQLGLVLLTFCPSSIELTDLSRPLSVRIHFLVGRRVCR